MEGTAARNADRGASAVEYCLLVAAVAAVAAVAIFALGSAATSPWTSACNSINLVAAEGTC